MATYLVALSLGPVQSLIEAARRTRDLWCGSWLLGEAAKAAALALHHAQPGCLVFPYFADAEHALRPSDRPDENQANVSNVLRAQIDVPDESAVRERVGVAKVAANRRLAALCEQARGKVTSLNLHTELWQQQTQDILEIFAAWVAIQPDTYRAGSQRLGALLAARKASRDFVPAATHADAAGAGKPKSSLDGARESVIALSREERKLGRNKLALRKLGLSAGEELDALALTKRMAGEIDQFTAYSRIAADSWIQEVSAGNADRFGPVARAYETLVPLELATRVSGNRQIYAALPYDAQLLFGFRRDNAIANASDDEDRFALKALGSALSGLGQPVPYAVVLKADGDHMGELLSRAASADASRDISHALHEFAGQVRSIIRQHRGHAIYAGGDDVLALLPLEHAVACAAELAEKFSGSMQVPASALGVSHDRRPTLSVGLGIGHLMEPLGRLRARADEAEKHAKGNGATSPRNALAIHLGIRSGASIRWRCRWNEGSDQPHTCAGVSTLRRLSAEYRQNTCPSGLGYELRAISCRLAWAKTHDEVLPEIQAAELTRTLDNARQRGSDVELSRPLKQFLESRAAVVGLGQLADELILARWLSARTASDLGAME